jgi:hypothetical protein
LVGLKKNDIVYLTLLRSHYLRAAGAKIHKKCSLKSDLEQCHSIRSRRPTFYLTGPAKGPSFDRAPFDGRAPVRPRFDILTPPELSGVLRRVPAPHSPHSHANKPKQGQEHRHRTPVSCWEFLRASLSFVHSDSDCADSVSRDCECVFLVYKYNPMSYSAIIMCARQPSIANEAYELRPT